MEKKLFKFDTNLNLTSSYVGEAAMELIHQAFLASKTIGDGMVTVKENVHRSWKIRRIGSTDLLAAKTCDFTPAGEINIDERSLDVCEFEVNLQLCKKDFFGDWSSVRMGRGMTNKSLAPDVAEAVISEILLSVGENIERLMWQADTGGTDCFDGIVTLALADGGVVGVPGAVIDSANVFEYLEDVFEAVSAMNIYNKPDLQLYVSRNVGAAYQLALGLVGTGLGYSNLATVGAKPWDYLGIPIFVAPGLPVDTIICTLKSNLYVGMDALSDMNTVILKDMTEIDLSNNVRFLAEFSLGVNYGWSEELVICHPDIVAP
ncbi:hypothetical protein AMJ86_00815 [bacterium SM23_57]|nr:MAG: hypothetical protein AMJ86_00815 [bacterium SM23_57]